jgi:hypothetical protein
MMLLSVRVILIFQLGFALAGTNVNIDKDLYDIVRCRKGYVGDPPSVTKVLDSCKAKMKEMPTDKNSQLV